MQLLYLLIFAIIKKVHLQDFLPNPNAGPHVSFEYVGENPLIYLDENVAEKITIAFINYKGTDQPRITQILEPSGNPVSALGASISREEENQNWELIISNAQNYEEITKYIFEVTFNSKISRVNLIINNEDDVNPFIQVEASSNPCKINETDLGQSSCFLTITDEDGVMDNTVIYNLDSSILPNINELFEIQNVQPLVNGMKTWRAIVNVKQQLDFERMSSYLLNLDVLDSAGNSDTKQILVQVLDAPDTDPIWTSVVSYVNIEEEEILNGKVQAIDGDLQINAPINYQITASSSDKEFFKVDPYTGDLTIGPINRDLEQKEIFDFTIEAYDTTNKSSIVEQSVTVVVADKNNNIPVITVSPDNVDIPENATSTLNITININDIDLGTAATYNVFLTKDQYSEAFQIIPSKGYQSQSFFISVIDSSKLDFENPDWKNFDLEICAQEELDASHIDRKKVHVRLTDWNDEPPTFEQDEFVVTKPEDLKAGSVVANVKANDRDEQDTIKYTLLGSAGNLFTIDQNGEIKTKYDNVFDYEKMETVIIQVQAVDSYEEPYHKTVAQVTVNVADVNDEAPIINVGPVPIIIEENVDLGKLEETDITAVDEDTDSDLRFSINWDQSRAVKNGQTVDQVNYNTCFQVETRFDDVNNRAEAVLKVTDVIDYEKFDTLYISLVVTDDNQDIEPKTYAVQISITVFDTNDNAPTFRKETITSYKKVMEMAKAGTIIGTVIADDEDGFQYNNITYSIKPKDSNVPIDWIEIDSVRGEIYVNANEKIDADMPLYEIEYVVTASDGKYTPTDTITIDIIDTNNKYPSCEFVNDSHILEASSEGTTIDIELKCIDEDRDAEYNTPWFRMSATASEEVKSFFSIDNKTGILKVTADDPTKNLDRDNGRLSFDIPFIVLDNYGQENSTTQNREEYKLTLYLDDINDELPNILTTNLNGNENMKPDDFIGEINAIDKDDKNNDNSKISFEIKKITKQVGGGGTDPSLDMFELKDEDSSLGVVKLYSGRDLATYYGVYVVEIEARDHGDPVNKVSGLIEVLLERYNFEPPIFIFPNNVPIYLAKQQSLNAPLRTYQGEILRSFEASDQQGEKWELSISILPETNPNQAFGINLLGNNKGDLVLKQFPDLDSSHTLTLIADCKCTAGVEPFTSQTTITIAFVDNDSEPTFSNSSHPVEFKENATEISVQLPKAYFNEEGEEWDIFTPYYFLQDSNMSRYFEIDKETAVLTVVEALDRESTPNFDLKVITSKDPDGNFTPAAGSILKVSVTVLDINDNSPYFSANLFYNGVKQSDELEKSILKITANDEDNQDEKLTFEIIGTINAVGDSIEHLNNPFCLGTSQSQSSTSTSGEVDVLLNFNVLSNMKGYFEFNVSVADKVDHQAQTTVKIYVVSDLSRTSFKFDNNVSTVNVKQMQVQRALEDNLEYICNIETIVPATNDEGEPVAEQTDVITHFVDKATSEAIDGETIKQLASNAEVFSKLQSQLLAEGLYLLYFQNPQVQEGSENELKAWLIAVSVVLGTICALLIIAFILKTRSLLKKIKQLSVPKSDYQDSNEIKIIPPPNTNKRAMQGSNPAYREEKRAPENDHNSVNDDDDELVGVEENENFDYFNDSYYEKAISKDEEC